MNLPFKYGVVSDVQPGYAKVYFEEDDIVTDWWPILMRTTLKDKESWPLNVQEHVVCLCDHRAEEGVVLGAIHNSEDTPDPGAASGKFRKVFDDGTLIEYDKTTHELKATVVPPGKVTITAIEVDIIGNLAITGDLSFSGAMTGGASGGGQVSFDGTTLKAPKVQAAGTIELTTHVHSGVQSGSAETTPPV